MNIKVVIALNMYDELEKKGANLDIEALGRMIGIPIIPTVASKGKGINELFEKLIEVYEDKDPMVRHIHINYGFNIENAIGKSQSLIRENKEINRLNFQPDTWLSSCLKPTHNLKHVFRVHKFEKIRSQVMHEIKMLEKE